MADKAPRRALPFGSTQQYWDVMRSIVAMSQDCMRRCSDQMEGDDQTEATITYQLDQVRRAQMGLSKLTFELGECLKDLEYVAPPPVKAPEAGKAKP